MRADGEEPGGTGDENRSEGQVDHKLYLSKINRTKIDTLILGCTHYPILECKINAYFDKKINIIHFMIMASLMVFLRKIIPQALQR